MRSHTYLIIFSFLTTLHSIHSMEDQSKLSEQKTSNSGTFVPALKKTHIVATNTLKDILLTHVPALTTTALKATTNALAAPADTLAALGAAALLAPLIGRSTYHILDKSLEISPETNYLIYTGISAASFTALGIYAALQRGYSGRKLDCYQRNWEEQIKDSVKPLGETQTSIKNDIELAFSDAIEPKFAKKVFILEGPPGTGKTTTAEHMPLVIKDIVEKKGLKAEGSPIPVTYYHIPLTPLLQSKYTVNLAHFLSSIFASANAKALSGNEIPIVFIDEATAILGNDTGKNATHFRTINDAVKAALDTGKNQAFVVFATNSVSAIEDGIKDRGYQYSFKKLDGDALKQLIKQTAITRASEKHRPFIQKIVEDKDITEDLTQAIILKGKDTSGRAISDAALAITVGYGKAVEDATKSSYYSQKSEELQNALTLNCYKIAIENFAKNNDSRQRVESVINPTLLGKTEQVLKSMGALVDSPYDPGITTAHHIAPLLEAQKVSVDNVEKILTEKVKKAGSSSFLDIISACCDDKTDAEILAQASIAPWMLSSKSESAPDANSDISDSRTAPLIATLAVVKKKEGEKVQPEPNLAFATRKDVLGYSQKQTKYSAFTEAAKKNVGQRSPYLTALGTGFQKNNGMFDLSANQDKKK